MTAALSIKQVENVAFRQQSLPTLGVVPQSNLRARREVITDNRILLHCMDAYVSGCTSSVKACITYSQDTGSLLPC